MVTPGALREAGRRCALWQQRRMPMRIQEILEGLNELNSMKLPVRTAEITDGVWEFSRVGEGVVTRVLRFRSDGSLFGYDHPNERSWSIVDGILCLHREDGLVTTAFTQVGRDDGVLVLQGTFVSDPSLVYRLVRQESWPQFGASMKFELADGVARYGWKIGDHTYGAPQIFEPGQAQFEIGKFCSVAGGVTIALGNHDIRNVSSYPFATLREYWPSVVNGATDHSTAGDVKIGNDVWISANAFVGSGVTIGDGAVVGAHSVVTKNVPPYTIVAGNPARALRPRFEPDLVERLLQIGWWDWPIDVIDRHLPMIVSHDIRAFVEHAERLPRSVTV